MFADSLKDWLKRYSTEIYLMFSLGREDLFPTDDLAELMALGRLKGLAEKPIRSRLGS